MKAVFKPTFAGVLFLLMTFMAACGSDSSEGSAVTVNFKVFKDGGNVECSAVSEIARAEISVQRGVAGIELPGFPQPVDCQKGSVELTLSADDYTIIISAYDSTNTLLYQARRPVTVPVDGPLEFSLEPQKGRVKLIWSFTPDDDLSPCGPEVSNLDVTLAAGGTSGDSFTAQLDCSTGEAWLTRYFNARSYTLLVLGVSSEGYTVYKTRTSVAVERGENEVSVSLVPEGGKITFDWQFLTPDKTETADCSAIEIDVSSAQLSISTELGDEPINVNLTCSSDQSYALLFKRFTQGTMLNFELLADGVHKYRFFEQFVMPASDKNFGLVSLKPVGNAEIRWSVTSTSTCNGEPLTGFEISIADEGQRIVRRESVSSSATNLAVSNIPYGTYNIAINGKINRDTICQTSGLREVTMRGNNVWDEFSL